MAMTVTGVMRDVHNFFEDGYIDGSFEVTAGGKLLPADAFVSGQFIAISGSAFHDGVYRFQDGFLFDALTTSIEEDGDTIEYLPDEMFSGRIWTLKPPYSFLQLCKEVAEFTAKTPVTGLQSESFGNYSYQRASGQNGVLTWQEAFVDALRPYRRMFTEVNV